MNVLTKIAELLFIVATYILFSLKFSSFLSDCFVLKKHLTDEFLKKKCRCSLFFKLLIAPGQVFYLLQLIGDSWFFFLFLFLLILWFKKCFSSVGFSWEGMERQRETFHMLEWTKSGKELEYGPLFLRSVSRLKCCWVSEQYLLLKI